MSKKNNVVALAKKGAPPIDKMKGGVLPPPGVAPGPGQSSSPVTTTDGAAGTTPASTAPGKLPIASAFPGRRRAVPVRGPLPRTQKDDRGSIGGLENAAPAARARQLRMA